jgi:hypothetical protein
VALRAESLSRTYMRKIILVEKGRYHWQHLKQARWWQ